jgi:[ribosomal protein S5]-alanine N-acetyltransferase
VGFDWACGYHQLKTQYKNNMLKDGNIVLRPPTEADRQPMAQLANNKNVWNNLRNYIPFPYTEQDAAQFIKLVQKETTITTFGIAVNEQFCGVIGLVPQTDVYAQSAGIGYWLGEPFWRKGIATRAVRLITHYGLNELNLVRVFTGVFEYNTASMRVLEKNEYVKEAVFKKAITKNGRLCDEHRYAIVK